MIKFNKNSIIKRCINLNMRCKELESMNWTEVLYKYDQAVKELTVKFETIMNDYRRLGMYSPIDSVTDV